MSGGLVRRVWEFEYSLEPEAQVIRQKLSGVRYIPYRLFVRIVYDSSVIYEPREELMQLSGKRVLKDGRQTSDVHENMRSKHSLPAICQIYVAQARKFASQDMALVANV